MSKKKPSHLTNKQLTGVLKHTSCRELVDELLVLHGAQELLESLAQSLADSEGIGNGFYVAEAIRALAKVEW